MLVELKKCSRGQSMRAYSNVIIILTVNISHEGSRDGNVRYATKKRR